VSNRRPPFLLDIGCKYEICGKFAVAGGAIELGEFPIDAALRELFEETDIKDVRLNAIPVVTSYFYPDFGIYWFCFWFGIRIKERIISFVEKDSNGDPKSGPWLWYPLDDLPTPLFPASEDVIKKNYDPTCLTFTRYEETMSEVRFNC